MQPKEIGHHNLFENIIVFYYKIAPQQTKKERREEIEIFITMDKVTDSITWWKTPRNLHPTRSLLDLNPAHSQSDFFIGPSAVTILR